MTPAPADGGLTERAAAWSCALTEEQVPDDVRDRVRIAVLDTVAAAIAGAATDVAIAVRAFATAEYAAGMASVVGGTERLRAPGAALVNATAAHVLEFDDGYTEGNVHPSAIVVPAVLAVVEDRGLAPADVLPALAVGLETVCRLGASLHPAAAQAGFHTTPVAGVIGAAIATARACGAPPEQARDAIGIAASHAGGLFEFLAAGADVKPLHAGKAARDGVAAAYLAQRGIRGPRSALEGNRGYLRAFGRWDGADDRTITAWSEDWLLRRMYLKPYPCCRHLHSAIEATLALRATQGFDAARITDIDVTTYPLAARHSHTNVNTVGDAQMSLPFVVAAAARLGPPTLTSFAADARVDRHTLDLAEKVTVGIDPQAEAGYPRRRMATVVITLDDGDRRTAQVECPRGEVANALSESELLSKVRGLCHPVIGSERTEALISATLYSQSMGSAVLELLTILRNSRPEDPLRRTR